MESRVVALCRELGGQQAQETVLAGAARSACQRLRQRLRPGVKEEDCGEVFVLAAALLALDTMEEVSGESAVTSFSAGQVRISKTARADMLRKAVDLLSPWMTAPGFWVKGAAG